MTSSRTIFPLAVGGLLIGLMLGSVAAGVYASLAVGRDAANVGFTTILDFFPTTLAAIPHSEPIRTALVVWGGIAAALAIAVPALAMRRQLTSHGSARWATEADMRHAGLITPLKTLNGPIYGKLGSPKSRGAFLSSTQIPHSLIAAPTGSGKRA